MGIFGQLLETVGEKSRRRLLFAITREPKRYAHSFPIYLIKEMKDIIG